MNVAVTMQRSVMFRQESVCVNLDGLDLGAENHALRVDLVHSVYSDACVKTMGCVILLRVGATALLAGKDRFVTKLVHQDFMDQIVLDDARVGTVQSVTR